MTDPQTPVDSRPSSPAGPQHDGGTMNGNNGITVATWLSVAGIYLTGAGLSYAVFGDGPARWPVGTTSAVLTALIWLAIHGHSGGWWEQNG